MVLVKNAHLKMLYCFLNAREYYLKDNFDSNSMDVDTSLHVDAVQTSLQEQWDALDIVETTPHSIVKP